jgi:hypothetical protein
VVATTKAGADTPALPPAARLSSRSGMAVAQAWFLTFVRMTIYFCFKSTTYSSVILGAAQRQPGIS